MSQKFSLEVFLSYYICILYCLTVMSVVCQIIGSIKMCTSLSYVIYLKFLFCLHSPNGQVLYTVFVYFNIYGYLHHKYISIYIQQDATLHSLFISGNCPTCFGWYLHPSSGAHIPVSTASGICHAITTTYY